jgi:hypothetical protein
MGPARWLRSVLSASPASHALVLLGRADHGGARTVRFVVVRLAAAGACTSVGEQGSVFIARFARLCVRGVVVVRGLKVLSVAAS